jgi:hypothetical protein
MGLTFVTFAPADLDVAYNAYQWCIDTIGPQGGEWDWTDISDGRYTFQFNQESKANWFRLTWLS